ncbi:MAG TPA: hypothetical protein VEZ59_06415 [Sphingopyxis sp.]|nr:hypothetical protein [Sphingopyxis sp.]
MTRLSRDVQRFLIALLILAMFAGSIIVLTFVVVPEVNRDAIIQLVGGVNTLAGLVIGFYFGKSAAEDHPTPVHVVQPEGNPVPVEEQR